MEILLRIQDRYSYDPDESVRDNEELKIDSEYPSEGPISVTQSPSKASISFYKIDPKLGIIITNAGKIQAFDRNGLPASWDKWITESSSMLTPDYFCLNQSYIIHKSVIAAAWFSSREDALFVKLDCYKTILKVARSKRRAFRTWCREYGIPVSKERSNISMASKLK